MDELTERSFIGVNKEAGQNRLNKWAEQGFNEQAVALYGTETGVLQTILSTGQIPAMPSDLAPISYQQGLMRDNRYLFYLMPFVDRIAKVNPKIARLVVRRFPGGSLKDLHRELQTESIREVGKSYALRHSIESAFYERSGITADVFNVLFVAQELLPDKLARFNNDNPFFAGEYELEINKDKKVQENIRKRFNDQQLAEILDPVLDRRGVLIYFNKGILTKHKIVPCPEVRDEIILVGNQPLTQEVISGVEVLSDSDNRVLKVA